MPPWTETHRALFGRKAASAINLLANSIAGGYGRNIELDRDLAQTRSKSEPLASVLQKLQKAVNRKSNRLCDMAKTAGAVTECNAGDVFGTVLETRRMPGSIAIVPKLSELAQHVR